MQDSSPQSFFNQLPPKIALTAGFVVALTVFSLIANVVMTSYIVKSVRGNTYATNYPTAPSAPTADPGAVAAPTGAAAIQTFTIVKDDHVLGNAKAKITMVEYSDFQCPYCGQHYPTLKKILADYKDKVRLVYRHYPLSFHENAQKAAEASECASEQGKFWEFHDKAFENQNQLSPSELTVWAQQIGLNVNKFTQCLDSGKYATRVSRDLNEGTQKGVEGTPATFVNGQLLSGALPYDKFKQVIDQALAQ